MILPSNRVILLHVLADLTYCNAPGLTVLTQLFRHGPKLPPFIDTAETCAQHIGQLFWCY